MSFAKMISMPLLGLVIAMCLFSTSIFTTAYPSAHLLDCRDEPDFPEQPPSCAICATNYDGISSCAQAAPVLANFTSVSGMLRALISLHSLLTVNRSFSTPEHSLTLSSVLAQTLSKVVREFEDLVGIVSLKQALTLQHTHNALIGEC